MESLRHLSQVFDSGREVIILHIGRYNSAAHWPWCNPGSRNSFSLPGGTLLPGGVTPVPAQQSTAFSQLY